MQDIWIQCIFIFDLFFEMIEINWKCASDALEISADWSCHQCQIWFQTNSGDANLYTPGRKFHSGNIYSSTTVDVNIFENWYFAKFLWLLWLTIWNNSNRYKFISTRFQSADISIYIFQGHIYKCVECLEIKYNEPMTWTPDGVTRPFWNSHSQSKQGISREVSAAAKHQSLLIGAHWFWPMSFYLLW